MYPDCSVSYLPGTNPVGGAQRKTFRIAQVLVTEAAVAKQKLSSTSDTRSPAGFAPSSSVGTIIRELRRTASFQP